MTTVTVQLSDDLEKTLIEEAKESGLSYAEILADAYKRMTFLRRVKYLRSKMVSGAEDLGAYSGINAYVLRFRRVCRCLGR